MLIRNITAPVREILEMTGFNEIMTIKILNFQVFQEKCSLLLYNICIRENRVIFYEKT